MPNYISFTSPGSGNFIVSAASTGQSPPYDETWTVVQAGTTVLKFYATGTTTPEIPQANLVVGNYYDVYAFESNGTTPKDVDWSGTNIEFIESFAYTADRRPIFQGGYAIQATSATNTSTYGVTDVDYRKTPASGLSMTNTATNGKLAWLTDKIKPAADQGIERFQLWNIAGWTSFGGDQPHYPSNSYTGLSLESVPLYIDPNSTAGAITQATPFTDTGMSGATIGDNEEAWTAGVAALKSWVTTATPAATPEITAYQGYRPCYANSTLPYTIQKTQLGYSPSSTYADGWTGTGNSPGFTPEPGFDGPNGFTTSPAAMAAWFDEEFIGLRSLGFDGIALDTGTRVYDNAAGYANGTIPAGISNPDGTSSNAFVNYFNSWGIKPTFEAVGLDTWTDGTGKLAIPATDGRYAASAYCALFGAWWGYEGNANGEQVVTADYNKAGTTETEAPSGGYFFGDAVGGPKVGNGANAAAFTAEAEVHVIFQWGTGTYMSRIMQGTNGDANSGVGVGWTGMKQIMWDCRAAGMIVSAGGSMETSMTVIDPNTSVSEVITPQMFLDYVKLLYTDPALVRPNNSITPGSYLQKITWTMTAADKATLSDQSGLEIISTTQSSLLLINSGPRFWNGIEADNYGATLGVFDTTAQTTAWWENYQVRIRQDGGGWMTMDGATPGTIYVSPNTKYNNIGSTPGVAYWGAGATVWVPQAAPQVIEMEVYTQGEIPV